MALAASWTHGNVTELKSHPSVTKTPRGWGAELSLPRSGTVNSHTFDTALQRQPLLRSIPVKLAITCLLLGKPLWLPVLLIPTLWTN
jgi:hypothetical protein